MFLFWGGLRRRKRRENKRIKEINELIALN